jgi:hypothetical protein
MTYIDKRIKIKKISGKGNGFIATEDIEKDVIVIKEIPQFTINGNIIFSDVFQVLFNIFMSDNDENINKFKALYPNNLEEFNEHKKFKKKVTLELSKLKKFKQHEAKNIYLYFANRFNVDEVTLFVLKYVSNAFTWPTKNGDKPVILFTGSILNHSCIPNITFGKVDDEMHFVTTKFIKKGEELCDYYIDINEKKSQRQEKLLLQYNFICKCERCIEKDNNKLLCMDEYAKLVEKNRFSKFGYSKSKKIL